MSFTQKFPQSEATFRALETRGRLLIQDLLEEEETHRLRKVETNSLPSTILMWPNSIYLALTASQAITTCTIVTYHTHVRSSVKKKKKEHPAFSHELSPWMWRCVVRRRVPGVSEDSCLHLQGQADTSSTALHWRWEHYYPPKRL